MNLPNDSVILLSVVNTLLRDKYSNIADLCDDYGISEKDITDKLSSIGYTYNPTHNQFK
ncbi:MAG: DUF4250 domain-containing protein [Ruminococcus sp.]|nr:DUF4250 domain-containing protein [Ruminococcus sp.]